MFESVELAEVFEKVSRTGLMASTVRMQYSLKVQARREVEKLWGTFTAFGQSSTEFDEFMMNYEKVFLKEFYFPCGPTEDELEADKVVVVNVADPSEKKKVEGIGESLPQGFMCYVQCCGEQREEVYELFKEGPYTCCVNESATPSLVSVFVHKRKLWSGPIQQFNAERLNTVWGTFGAFEAAQLSVHPTMDRLQVWDFALGEAVSVNVGEGLCVLDVYNDNVKPLHVTTPCTVIHLYAGGIKKPSGYGLYPFSYLDQTVQCLGLFEFPTTFIVQNGEVLFRGNREFLDINSIIEQVGASKKLAVEAPSTLDKAQLKALVAEYKDLYSLVIGKSGLDVDFEFAAYSDFTAETQHAEHYKTCVSVYVADQNEQELAHKFCNKLKTLFPNLKKEVIFLEGIEFEAAESSGKTPEENVDALQKSTEILAEQLKTTQKQLEDSQSTVQRLQNELKEAAKKASRRDTQLLQVIDKAKQQELEIKALKQKLSAQHSERAKSPSSQWSSDEILRHLIAKDSEIAMLKELLNGNTLRSPPRLPPLKESVDSPPNRDNAKDHATPSKIPKFPSEKHLKKRASLKPASLDSVKSALSPEVRPKRSLHKPDISNR